jgi:hypothetical protein
VYPDPVVPAIQDGLVKVVEYAKDTGVELMFPAFTVVAKV